MNKYYIFVGIGVELVGIVLTMAYIGSWLEKKYNLNGLGIMGAILIGLISWLCHVMYLIKVLDKPHKKTHKKPHKKADKNEK